MLFWSWYEGKARFEVDKTTFVVIAHTSLEHYFQCIATEIYIKIIENFVVLYEGELVR